MKVSLLGVGLLALTSTIGFAQAAPAPMQRHAATINERREHQQQRIAQGIRTGRLDARQAGRLERREASIGRQERHMRGADGGRLNHFDRVRLNHRLNHTSRAIYRARHRSFRR
jgi:flagellar biosynthesis/type III secretory pathway protein FliH